MEFSSITFLYYFLPIVLLIYFVAPNVMKNLVLLLASLFFYAWGEPKMVLLMILTIFICYILSFIIDRYRDKLWSKIAFILALFVCLGFLGYFKYADFFIDNFNKLTGLDVKLLGIALPVGISFYTFQLLSYVVDVYRGNVKLQKNPINLFTYIAMFPQLVAGPIVRYQDIEQDLTNRVHSFDKVREGIIRFLIGLSKKMIIANQLGDLADIVRSSEEPSVLFVWVYAIAASLQIYFDFSGYSDMAIGLGKILGFSFPENFNYPYISGSITEFWRRWHMTLGGWFRDYVYIPMGGSRVSNARLFINIFTVWMLTGLWHGAAWNFVVWGLFFGILLVIEKLFTLKYIEKTKVIKHVYVLFMVMISFVIFSANDMGQAFEQLGNMFGLGNIPLVTEETLYYLRSYGVLLFMGIIGSTPIVSKAAGAVAYKTSKLKLSWILEPVALIVLLLLSTAYLVDGSYNPFLYFRF